MTEALLACATAPADFRAVCDAVNAGDRFVDARKGLDATGYPTSQESRGFACYVTFVACGVSVDAANRVTETRLARVRALRRRGETNACHFEVELSTWGARLLRLADGLHCRLGRSSMWIPM